MPLSGTFDTVNLPELLQWFHSTRKTGTLTVSVDLEETYLRFKQGDLVAVGSDDPLRLDLGQVLLRRGRLTEDELKRVEQLRSAGQSLPEALVQADLLSGEEMEQIQVDYLLDIVLDLFFLEQGSFHFSSTDTEATLLNPEHMDEGTFLEHPLSTQEVLMESMRRIDEWNRIRQVLPNRYVVVQVHPDAEPSAVVDELRAIGQPISVGELCLRLGRNRFDVYHQLYQLWEQKKLYLDETTPRPAEQADPGAARVLLDNARVLLREEQFDEAREILSTAASLDPDNPAVRTLVDELRTGQLSQLYQLVPPYRTLVLTHPRESLDALKLSQREKYIATRLTGKLDVATLIVSVPIGELQTLRILRKLLHAGLAAFAD